MIAHFQQDYTFYFEQEDIQKLLAGEEVKGELLIMEEPVVILLKEDEDIYKLKQKQPGVTIFSNETDYVVIHWKTHHHTLYFSKSWFTQMIERAKVIDQAVVIRWGAEKIHILAGEGSEAKKFKSNWGPPDNTFIV